MLHHIPALFDGNPPNASTTSLAVAQRTVELEELLAELDAEEREAVAEAAEGEKDEKGAGVGEAKSVPVEMLRTDVEVGLSEKEVLGRRKMFGVNRLREQEVRHWRVFMGFFVGPIQFVMEVSGEVGEMKFLSFHAG